MRNGRVVTAFQYTVSICKIKKFIQIITTSKIIDIEILCEYNIALMQIITI